MSFLQELQNKLGSHNPDDVDQLILDNMFEKVRVISDEMKEGIEKYTELRHLSLNNIGLSCLKNLPKLDFLEVLELRENLLTGNDFNLIVEAYPNLKRLRLGLNPIKKMEVFDVFKNADILSMELFETGIQKSKGYRDVLFEKIKSLEVIDQTDRDGYELESNFYNEQSDEYDEENEEADEDYQNDEDIEDEFDDDFNEPEEDLELSVYDENDDADKIKNGELVKKKIIINGGSGKKKKNDSKNKKEDSDILDKAELFSDNIKNKSKSEVEVEEEDLRMIKKIEKINKK